MKNDGWEEVGSDMIDWDVVGVCMGLNGVRFRVFKTILSSFT